MHETWGKDLSLIRQAETYLRTLARYPGDLGTELMPRDQQWTRAAKDLYRELSEEDRRIIDSTTRMMDIDKRQQQAGLRRLALKLLCKAGFESEYTILMMPTRERGDDNEGNSGAIRV